MGRNVLVVGSGAREHALAWSLKQSTSLDALFCAPGNAGTAAIATNLNIDAADQAGIAAVVEQHAIDLTIIGPEAPLAAGLADHLRAEGRLVFGPDRGAAQIESSKAWAKEIMESSGVPTAGSVTVDDLDHAQRVIESFSEPLVVKADGLAAGKGVVICSSREEARSAATDMLAAGGAGRRVLIEEFLEGTEVSLLVVTDGQMAMPLIPACDYKAVGEGDTGPNTGGMGAYAPPAWFDDQLVDIAMEQIINPTLSALRERGHDYRGVLYAGLMLTNDGLKVLEFNCRFGDPETQVVLPLLETDFLDLCLATARGELSAFGTLTWKPGAAVGVVLASGGYPGNYQTGLPITGLDDMPDDVLVLHAGTTLKDGQLVTSGGRVLTVVSVAENLAIARERTYAQLAGIDFEGRQYRNDIALRELDGASISS